MLIVLLLLVVHSDDELVLIGAIASGLIFLLFQLIWWKLIFCPYQKLEKEGKKFLDGYMPEGELVAAVCQFSPVVERLLQRLVELISPSRIFDQNK